MHTTTDHTEPRPEGCRCWRNDVCGYVCPKCAGELQKNQAANDLRLWLRAFGTLPDPGAPKR